MRTGTVALLILAIASAPSVGGSQAMPKDPTQTIFGSEIELTVVNIDVFVRDRDGRPVEGLTASDFRVFQDGVEMPISNFSAQNRGHLSLEEGEPIGSLPQDSQSTVRPAFVLLYFDNEYLHPVHRGRAMPRLREFVNGTMQGQVRMAVASARRSMVIRQPFTDDPEEVLAALDVVAHDSTGVLAREADRKRILDAMHEDQFFIAAQARPTIASIVPLVPGVTSKVEYRLTPAGLEQRPLNRNPQQEFKEVFGWQQLSHVVPVRNGFKYFKRVDDPDPLITASTNRPVVGQDHTWVRGTAPPCWLPTWPNESLG
jgi:hypothetical protein